MKNKENIIDKNLEIMQSQAEKVDRIEHFNFLKHLINLQSMHKYNVITQFEADYMSTLRAQLKKYEDRG
jgi:hypothetical protein